MATKSLIEFDQVKIAAREAAVALETDDQIMNRMFERFNILDEMSVAVKAGEIKAMIISGPPGIGKSFGVEAVMEKADLFTTIANKKPKYEVVKGNISALGLYAKLFEYSEKGQVLILDDADVIFSDELTLNILKAALDSSEHRWVSWNTDSRMLRTEGIPNRFEFCGSVIFITNIKFSHVRSKKLKEQLNALESRCHYIDLEMDTNREKLLRIKQIVDAGMLDRYDFDTITIAEIQQFVIDNQFSLRELSLRMVLKISDLRKNFPTSWQSMAKTTVMKR